MIKITDRFYINATTNCYTLQEKTTVQDENSENYGKEIYKDLGYYTSIENCLQGILKTTTREFISQEQENSVKELIEQVKLQNDFLKSLKLNF
jgi:hypothetical protein